MAKVDRERRWYVVILLAVLAGCAAEQKPAQTQWTAMGTQASILVGSGDQAQLQEYGATARKIMDALESELSLYRPTSDVSRLNAAAGAVPIPVGENLRMVLDLSRKYAELSGGAFDVTVGPLVRLWGFSGGNVPASPPDPTRLAEVRNLVDYREVVVTGHLAGLRRAAMFVDLGGIAKGFAVDRCCEALRRQGAADFVVNLGGNMRCFGRPAPGRAWRIGVRHPFAADALLGTLALGDGLAVATSGNYERFVVLGGKRYAHILDPRTGCPVEGMASVTVIAPSAVEADALSTALFVLGKDAAAELLQKLPGCEVLIVPDVQPPELWATAGFLQRFDPAPDLRDCLRQLK